MATVAMAREAKCTPTEISSKVTGSEVRDMDMECSDALMVLHMR